MELSEDYTVWTAKEGMSEPDILLYAKGLAERLAEKYGYCLMFEGNKKFRTIRAHKNDLVVEEH